MQTPKVISKSLKRLIFIIQRKNAQLIEYMFINIEFVIIVKLAVIVVHNIMNNIY